jgi:hypothetical protein
MVLDYAEVTDACNSRYMCKSIMNCELASDYYRYHRGRNLQAAVGLHLGDQRVVCIVEVEKVVIMLRMSTIITLALFWCCSSSV